MAAIPHPFCQPKSGSATRSSRFPSTFRHKLIPGAPACVNARSIQPSLSKSNATTPTAGGSFSLAKSIPSSALNFPSRGFNRMVAPVAPPARTKSIARSLLKSVVTTPDRKSTRLNSSHSQISYAVFCLKKKKTDNTNPNLLDQIVLLQPHAKPHRNLHNRPGPTPHQLLPPDMSPNLHLSLLVDRERSPT